MPALTVPLALAPVCGLCITGHDMITESGQECLISDDSVKIQSALMWKAMKEKMCSEQA